MKQYRIIYWLGSIQTEWITKAKDADEAVEKFVREKGEEKRNSIYKVIDDGIPTW